MRRFLRNTSGVIAIVTAMLLPVMIGLAAWAIDASLLLYRQERLQIAVDIGARAGAEIIRRGGTEADAQSFARQVTEINAGAPDGTLPQVTIGIPKSDRVEVNATLQVKRFFSAVFGQGDFTVEAASIAVFTEMTSAGICVYVEHPRAQRALRLDRNSTLSLTGCDVAVASDHGRALVLERESVLRAGCVDVVGGISGSSQIELFVCESPNMGAEVGPPRFLVENPPQPSGACATKDRVKIPKNGKPDKLILTPVGRHPSGLAELRLCDGLKVDHDTVGGPGIYFVAGKNLKIEGGATLSLGPGAIIVLEDDVEIDMEPTARLRISAPQNGTFSSLSIIAGHNRRKPKKRKHNLGLLEIEGAIVLPDETIEIKGNNLVGRCANFVVGQFELSRDAHLTSTCDSNNMQETGSVRILPTP